MAGMFGELGSVGLDAPSLLPSTELTPIKAWGGNNAGAAHLSLPRLMYWVVITFASVRAIPLFGRLGAILEPVVQSLLALNIVYTVNMLAFIWSSTFWHLCLNIAKAKGRRPCRPRNAVIFRCHILTSYVGHLQSPSYRCKFSAPHWTDAGRITNWADNATLMPLAEDFLPYRGRSANSVCPFPGTIEALFLDRLRTGLPTNIFRHLGVSVTTLTSPCPESVNKLDINEAGRLQEIGSSLNLEVATEMGI
ncbi:hypothetical protein ASPBRDRAFT_116910 [Aspergillus brasiliensis CBS 101740]|uniref:Uncharacterized protein n=1 Tax=Aspergillus brasiliensis (strain CBS 101740 / IMI 381727 / IBT 21946) TaxID=767769 RepID=A0A1L9UXH9_ASPBC|nr:hypothetical protein ASPBRDRAFT_116910 [Aspergillus brasiliensis CBS 101740]